MLYNTFTLLHNTLVMLCNTHIMLFNTSHVCVCIYVNTYVYKVTRRQDEQRVHGPFICTGEMIANCRYISVTLPLLLGWVQFVLDDTASLGLMYTAASMTCLASILTKLIITCTRENRLTSVYFRSSLNARFIPSSLALSLTTIPLARSRSICLPNVTCSSCQPASSAATVCCV